MPAAAPFRLVPPEPLELDIHERCAEVLDKLLLPPAMWFTYPAGAVQLSPAQAARLSRVGLRRGLPDIWILFEGAWCIELKRRGGQLSRTRIVRTRRGSPRVLEGQEDVFPRLIAAGVRRIAVCHTPEGMLAALERWGIPLRSHHR
jgi:hypothetical protein